MTNDISDISDISDETLETAMLSLQQRFLLLKLQSLKNNKDLSDEIKEVENAYYELDELIPKEFSELEFNQAMIQQLNIDLDEREPDTEINQDIANNFNVDI